MGTLHAIFRWCAKAPSHVTDQILPLFPFFSFVQKALQARKLIKLKKMVGEGREVELEGEAVAGPSGEATV